MGGTIRRNPKLLTTAAASIVLMALSGINPSAALLAQDPGFAGRPETRAAAFEIYVQQLGFGEIPGSEVVDERFACADAGKCGGQASVSLRVVPSNYATDVSWADALGTGKGHVVAKIVVADPVPFDRFNLLADDVVYLWVGTIADVGPAGKGAVLYRVRGGTVTPVFKFPTLRYCKYQGAPQKPSVHRRAMCTDPSPVPPGAATSSSAESIASLTARPVRTSAALLASEGLWISCSIGCCEAQYTGLF